MRGSGCLLPGVSMSELSSRREFVAVRAVAVFAVLGAILVLFVWRALTRKRAS